MIRIDIASHHDPGIGSPQVMLQIVVCSVATDADDSNTNLVARRRITEESRGNDQRPRSSREDAPQERATTLWKCFHRLGLLFLALKAAMRLTRMFSANVV